jgi:hypothetical protein
VAGAAAAEEARQSSPTPSAYFATASAAVRGQAFEPLGRSDRSGQSIVNPNAEIAEGLEAGVMPDDVGDKLSEQEVSDLVAFLEDGRLISAVARAPDGRVRNCTKPVERRMVYTRSRARR